MKVCAGALSSLRRASARLILASAAVAAAAMPPAAGAQNVERLDPDDAFRSAPPASSGIDADLTSPQAPPAPAAPPATSPPPAPLASAAAGPDAAAPPASQGVGQWSDGDFAPAAAAVPVAAAPAGPATYGEDDLIGAAEGIFGKGAEGLAKLIEGILAKQGRPNAYIVGREAGGALVVGARYGSGTLHHKIEGDRKVYWTGPSIGFDAGANASNTFVLVYNLYDSEDLFERFAAGEGQAYFVGGFHASYLRKGDKVLIPIRVGAGLRLGINAGYMRFSEKQRWLPF
ncbi:MAG: DUF1134 domain-containing protein [Erythrobacter sp.]